MQELKLPGYLILELLPWHVVVYLGDTFVTCKTFLYLTRRLAQFGLVLLE